ncbi:MAG: hypothetical protein K2I89_04205 [Muribaculaceae bacterium]|nr:hypothetical protein [Muribaculaceae bacterium]MDE5594759.1 hypothetical protein [Muribaculaceae bacterium]
MKLLKLISIFVLIIFTSCQSELLLDEPEPSLPYLNIDGEIDINNLSAEELQILFLASQRFQLICNEDGLYEISPKNYKELSISENIFCFFQEIVESSNDNCDIRRHNLISRDPIGYGSDCVVWAIANATGMSYYDVFNHVLASTGFVGVTKDNMFSVLGDPRYGGSAMDVNSFSSPEALSTRYVIVYHDPEYMDENTYHAVNGFLQTSNDQFICKDYQNNCSRIVDSDMIKAIYYY